MYETIETLKKSKIVSKVNLLELIEEESVKAVKLEVFLIDDSLLYINQVFRKESYRYSYHWQTESGEMLIRWDNAPHWKKLKTFPHHKHSGDKILSTHQPLIEEVLAEIKHKILERKQT